MEGVFQFAQFSIGKNIFSKCLKKEIEADKLEPSNEKISYDLQNIFSLFLRYIETASKDNSYLIPSRGCKH